MPYEEPFDSGARLGMDAVEHVGRCAEEYCRAECERIALVNEPRVNVLQMEGRELAERSADLVERLRHIPAPPNDVGARKRRARFCWAICGVLVFAAFAFTLIGFGPYRLGLIGVLYCLGIAAVTPFAVDEFLRAWNSDHVVKVAVSVVFAAALIGGALLAVVRGELLVRETAPAAPPAVIEGEAAPAADSRPSFYDATEDSLKLLLLLFAIAIDLAGGVAIYRARQEAAVDDDAYRQTAQELATVRGRLAEVVFETTALRNAPAVAAAQFWRDFYRAMLTQTVRKAVQKVLLAVVLACLLWPGRGLAAERVNLVVALDLSSSESAQGPDGKTPFERNIAGISRLLASVPAGSHVTVIGITEDSLRDPAPLLAASISDDVGFFGERLQTARLQLVRAWRARAARLKPEAPGTDIIGALFLAGDILQRTSGAATRILAIFSDMRNATRALNLEAPLQDPVPVVLSNLEAQGKIAALAGVTVSVAGANGGGEDLRNWQNARDFWLAYFERARARCGEYSMLATPRALLP
jgi:uncharacterized membrane protein